MSYFSDIDIKKALNKDIVIEPFSPDCLTPIGYDFRIGDYVFSLENGLVELVDGYYELPPKSTIQILTMESLWVSSRVAGTFHSKVSLVSKGLSHISTTLDPLWYGPLLITLRNNMDKVIKVQAGDSFVTLLFTTVRTPTKTPHNKPSHRGDILLDQLNEQTENYIKKITGVLQNKNASIIFANKVREANQPMIKKLIKASSRSVDIEYCIKTVFKTTLLILIALLISLSFIWGSINSFFHYIEYDTKVFAVQVTAIISLISMLMTITKKPS